MGTEDQEPGFRARVEELRGKHLLCWGVQAGPKRADWCHARVWLELASGKQTRPVCDDRAAFCLTPSLSRQPRNQTPC